MMASPNFSVAGKHVLITGGRGGIGKAMGLAFRDAGAQVTLADLGDAPHEADGMRNVTLDVRDDAACAALARNLGTLDVLIQCAGKLARIKEYETEVFEDVVATHLFGSFRLAVAMKPLLAARKGCIINIGSMYSYFGSPHAPAYGAAKAALVQLTKSLAIAWAKDGVRVNCIAPGWVITELTRGGRENPEFFAKVTARLPNGRWAEPAEVAGPAVFLASDAASLITGATLAVDGGYSVV
jgi:NAD(P)-dependent dehydrogenase (short-subunit alcohol dehydrogenase family)